MDSILEAVGRTPLVRLSRLDRGLPLPVYGKCEFLNPAGSVKDRLALALVREGEESGLLPPGGTMIEATAGNTGLGLAMVAALRGFRLVCVMPEKMSQDKRQALRALGAQVVVTENAPPDDPRNFQNVARRMAEERGWFLTDQFRSRANVQVHEETTGPEIFETLQGRVGALVAGVGTGGTLTGAGRFLKSRAPGVRVVLADPRGSALGAWVRTGEYGPDGPYRVEGIGSSRAPEIFDRAVVDEVEEVSDEESFATARRLVREEGLLVGGSSGTAVAAALRVAARGEAPGPVVAVLPDSWDRYFTTGWLAEGGE